MIYRPSSHIAVNGGFADQTASGAASSIEQEDPRHTPPAALTPATNVVWSAESTALPTIVLVGNIA
jgi:hypothetical protein